MSKLDEDEKLQNSKPEQKLDYTGRKVDAREKKNNGEEQKVTSLNIANPGDEERDVKSCFLHLQVKNKVMEELFLDIFV